MNELSHLSREALAAALLAPVSAVSDAALPYCAADDTPARPAEIVRRLAIAREILLRDLETQLRRSGVLDSPKTVREYLMLHYAHLPHEVFGVLSLDAQNRLIEAELQMFRGTLTRPRFIHARWSRRHWHTTPRRRSYAQCILRAHPMPRRSGEGQSRRRDLQRRQSVAAQTQAVWSDRPTPAGDTFPAGGGSPAPFHIRSHRWAVNTTVFRFNEQAGAPCRHRQRKP